MGQFKVLILVSLAIMSLNSCNGQQVKSDQNNIVNYMLNDTILLTRQQYKIVSVDSNHLDVELIDLSLIEAFKKAVSPILKIDLNGTIIIVKGNNILSSSIPDNCDYFYPLNDEKKVVLHNNQLNLRKVNIPN